MADQIIDPFHRALNNALLEEIGKRMVQLSEGSAAAIVGGSSSTAENYAAQTSYIKALHDVLGLCKDLEQAQYGLAPPQDDEAA